MTKLPVIFATLLVFTACSTKTLVNLNVDADSFIPAATRSGSVDVVAGAIDYRFPDDDGDAINGNDPDGAILTIPSVKFTRSAALNVKLTLNTSAPGSLEIYVAPGNTAAIYQAQYRVLQAPSSGSSFAGSVNLSSASSDPAQVQAFQAIQSGNFRIGARLKASPVAGTTAQYTVDDLTVGVSGYPINALF